jgi:hypothetical protein
MAFVPYLTVNDYYTVIQPAQFKSISQREAERQAAEAWAISSIRQFLSAKYDLDFEFTPTSVFDFTKQYRANDRVIMDFAPWVAGTSYEADALMVLGGSCYQCTIPNSDTTFDSSKWNLFGTQYDMFYVPLPYPLFQQQVQTAVGAKSNGYYDIGDKVWWDNHIYTALAQTVVVGGDVLQQYPMYNDVPPNNVFPGAKNSENIWKDEGEYILEAGVMPFEPAWIKADNRDPKIVEAMVDISIYRLLSRVNANNVPDARKVAFHDQMAWLACVKRGDLTIDIEEKQPEQNYSFFGTSKVKKRNGY